MRVLICSDRTPNVKTPTHMSPPASLQISFQAALMPTWLWTLHGIGLLPCQEEALPPGVNCAMRTYPKRLVTAEAIQSEDPAFLF